MYPTRKEVMHMEDLKEIAEMVLANVVAAIIVSAIERHGSTHERPKHMR